MRTEEFRAGVQYNDSKGTAAADDHDSLALSHYMQSQGLIQNGETIVGVKMFSGEVHGSVQNQPVSVTAYVIAAAGFEGAARALESDGPLDVREIRFDIDLAKFFGLFKRFEIAISRYDELGGRELNILD